MQNLTEAGQRIVREAAQRHGFSEDAVLTMLRALSAGYGTQAQFNHYEFGGMGQWSAGGMLMIGDMFNNQLKGRIASLAQELAGIVQSQPMFERPAQSQSQSQGGGWQGGGGQQQSQGGGWQGQGSGGSYGSGQQQSQNGITGSSLFVPGGGNADWWPSELGQAASVGAQNNMRYAYFPSARRLAIDLGGNVTVYDTGEHQIGGFSQQQSGDQSLLFTSQFGLVRVADLRIVNAAGSTAATAAPAVPPAPQSGDQPAAAPAASSAAASTPTTAAGSANSTGPISSSEVLQLLEKLADLHAKGILTSEEYAAKKAELLKRL